MQAKHLYNTNLAVNNYDKITVYIHFKGWTEQRNTEKHIVGGI